jgi:hypothetical protein
MNKTMKKLLIMFLLIPTLSFSQSDSLRLERIDSTMREYGRQQTIANKITIVSIVTIGVGTVIGIPAVPLLIVNTLADLVTITITSKSNKRLAKHKSK